MGITDLITSTNDSMNFDVSLQETLDFMIENKVKHIVLIKHKKAVGILTERDVLFLYTKHIDFKLKAFDFANTTLISSKENRKTDYILSLMVNHDIRRIIINNKKNEYLGSILQEDLIYQFEQDVYKFHIRIEDILKKSDPALYLNKEVSVQESIEIMSSKNIGSILIYDNNKPIGIITESDIVALAQKNIDTNENIQKHENSTLNISRKTVFHILVISVY